jgi:pyridoxamine 5'-phosphate oxidase
LTGGGSYQVLLWYPTMQRQYRISGTMEFVDDAFVKTSWLRRPRGSKLLDLYYEHRGDQSSLINSRATLVDSITELRQTFELDDLKAPTKVAGIEFVAAEIEMLDLNREDRIHDRQLFRLEGDDWVSQYLVP